MYLEQIKQWINIIWKIYGTVEAQIASLVKTRDKILAGMADENKKQTMTALRLFVME